MRIIPRLPRPFAKHTPPPAPPPTLAEAATNVLARLVAARLVPVLERAVARGIGRVGSAIAQRVITVVARRLVHPIIERVIVVQLDRLAQRLVVIMRAKLEARSRSRA